MKILVETSPMKPVVEALQALRGVAFITATTLIAEIGDLERFDHPANLMAYAGVVPSERTSDTNRKQGGITKTGNSKIRHVDIEAAWHYRRKPLVSQALKKRQEGLSQEVKAISWKAQHRLNLKYRRLVSRNKEPNKAVVAVARKLLGFIWTIGQQIAMERKTGKYAVA